METDDDTSGMDARVVVEAKEDTNTAEIKLEDDLSDEESRKAEIAKNMAERVTDLRKQKGSRSTSEGSGAEETEAADDKDDNKDKDIENSLFTKCLTQAAKGQR